tara:strand:+ start:25 stop:477 length:453 start_codon:yes stop_codon:yes gene_type:complete
MGAWFMMRESVKNDEGQMLLATGVVLMMSLLSMAIFGVKMAGISMPYESAGDDTIQASSDIALYLPELTEARAEIWFNEGVSEFESVNKSINSLHDDILHHGEIRGVELKLLNITVTEENGIITVSTELGAADRNSMLTRIITFDIDLDN